MIFSMLFARSEEEKPLVVVWQVAQYEAKCPHQRSFIPGHQTELRLSID